MIAISDLTLQYPSGKGIFELDFQVRQGESVGYLGPNGAGKTTTIRALLGFMAPNSGSATIAGLDCVKQAPEIQKQLGYIPGEIAFFDSMKGDEFLRFMQDMRGIRNTARQKELLERFELNPKGKIKKYSKGMKQKLGIVAAFLHDPQVLILDEPTSGLDPLMQQRFIELVAQEKARGKTVLMSSHMFEEVERSCDRVLIIKDGRIIEQSDIKTLKDARRKVFFVSVMQEQAFAAALEQAGFDYTLPAHGGAEVSMSGDRVDSFIKLCADFTLQSFDAKPQSLEDIFMQFYGQKGEAQ